MPPRQREATSRLSTPSSRRRPRRTLWNRLLCLSWLLVAGATGLVSGLGALLVLTPVDLGLCVVLSGLAGVGLVVLLGPPRPTGRAVPPWPALACGAVAGAFGGVSLVGLATLAGPNGALFLALLGLSSPWAVRHVVGLASGPTAPQPPHDPSATAGTWRASATPEAIRALRALQGLPSGPVLRELTTTQLCHAWRASFVVLTRTSDLRVTTRLVALRQVYLDELERREPDGFARWIAAGARAAGDPGRHLRAEGG